MPDFLMQSGRYFWPKPIRTPVPPRSSFPHRIDMQNVCYGARLMSELRLPAIYLALVELSCICHFPLAARSLQFAIYSRICGPINKHVTPLAPLTAY